jgi:uncharacterized protein (TIGR04141 family)
LPKVTIYRLLPRPHANSSFATYLRKPGAARRVGLTSSINGALFIVAGETRKPEWHSYLKPITSTGFDVRASTPTGAVLLLSLNGASGPTYACTWGTGHLQLKRHYITPDLGVRVAFNLLTDATGRTDRIRALRTKSLSSDRLLSETQAPRERGIDVFPLDRRKDLLRGVTGHPVESDKWGRLITGAASIHVQRPKDPTKLLSFCRDIEAKYHSDDYRLQYPWIDDLRPISDPILRSSLQNELVALLRTRTTDDLDLCPPDVVDWRVVEQFRFSCADDYAPFAVPSVDEYVAALAQTELLDELSFDQVSADHELVALDAAGEEIASWSMLECLSGSLSVSSRTYVLEAGTLYEVEAQYLAELDAYINSIDVDQLSLQQFGVHATELAYNTSVAASRDAALLDQAGVSRPHATEVELCDVAIIEPSKRLALLHVKRGKGSGAASYVLYQAAVSADLLHRDSAFCQAAARHLGTLPSAQHFFGTCNATSLGSRWLPTVSPGSCLIAVGMVSTWPSKPLLSEQLSFFVKVALRMNVDRLRAMSFTCSIERIKK